MGWDEPSSIEGRLIDARQALTASRWAKVPILYNHSLLAQLGMPLRNPKEATTWSRNCGSMSLQIESGSIFSGGEFKRVGIPYGTRARLVMLALCSAAVKSNSPIVELPSTFTRFVRELGIDTNGRNLRELREQIRRMSVVQMRLAFNHGTFIDQYTGPVFEKLSIDLPPVEDQIPMWPSTVEFSSSFYESLRHHAVPLRREAIMALSHSARAIDILSWLASRLYKIKANRPVRLKWASVRYQFGNRHQDGKGFKRSFRKALSQVLTVYPEAKVELIYGGLLLRQSPPPVPFAEYEKNRELLA